ncbi:MAG: hypothetical protein LBP73_03915 [Clostridiales Family XIII bacterium]|jgi:hypothetical protein|nr:hypothetical protein [Clostridiales Family XIII bacterium]
MGKTAISAAHIKPAPFALSDIESLDIRVAPNEHATAKIRGIIDGEAEEAYLSLARHDLPVRVLGEDDAGESEVLFAGTVSGLEIRNINGVKMMELSLVSASKRMDLAEHTRSFQKATATYEDVLSVFGYYKDYSFSARVGEGVQIGDILVQFRETDWEFVKRLAGRFNSVVIPDYLTGDTGFYFGLPVKSAGTPVDPIAYRVMKDNSKYADKTQNDVSGLSENDELYYIVQDPAIRRMGEKVRFKNQDLRVFAIRSVLEGQVLQNYYTLKSEAGFKTKKLHNAKLVGASLAGRVINVAKDRVQLRLYEDNDSYEVGAKWLHYSTVYSSPDGTGWYAMPEIGDELRLYFPSERESEGYAISAVNVDTPDMGKDVPPAEPGIPAFLPPRTHPNVKTVINKERKEVSLYPDKIVMTNNRDMTVVIDDADGITIQSAKNISIKSDEGVSLISGASDITLAGGESVNIEVGGTKLALNNNVGFEGTSIFMQ